MVAKIHRDPMKTKTGKPKLGPLNLEQLSKLLETCRKKDRSKIQKRISVIESKTKTKIDLTTTEISV